MVLLPVRSPDRFIYLEWDGFTVTTSTRTISGGIFYIREVWAGGIIFGIDKTNIF